MVRALAAALALAALSPAPAGAQGRPSEEELFGAPSSEPPSPPAPAGEGRGEGGGRPTEEELFGAPPSEPSSPPAPAGEGRGEGGDRSAPEKAARPEEAQLFGAPPAAQAAPPPPQRLLGREEDTLAVGGQLYLRAQATLLENDVPGDATLSSPNLLDVYLDARPNDRVRAFVLGRLSFDPTLPPEATPPALDEGLLSGASALGGARTSEPDGALDQLWINFDLQRRVFVTAGRQHAKWGVGRFWNPTDYLHPVKRDPLAVFDVRTGTTMVKLHAPWEARGWNVYAVAVLEDLAGDPRPTSTLGRVGVGGRAEIVLGPMELGLDALSQDGHRPRFGVDVSSGVWDLDLYAEAAIRTSVDTPRWRERPGTTPDDDLLLRFERRDRLGPTLQLVLGGNYAVNYSDEDAVTFGAEYFYDQSGYDSPRIYPVLLGVAALSGNPAFPAFEGQPSPFTPFYLGRHYGAAFVSLPAPGAWNDTTFTLSILGNLSDKSFVARLDHSVLALTYLRVETFVAGHFGAAEGEFRLGFDVPPGVVGGAPFPGFSSEPAIFEAGVALRVSL